LYAADLTHIIVEAGRDVSHRSGLRRRIGGTRSGGTAMQAESRESTLTTILWTVGALAIVVVIAVYMGMS
jgi:hypothetical protein